MKENMNFLSFHYWFNSRPGDLSSAGLKLFVLFLGALLIAAFIALVKTRSKQNIYKKVWGEIITFAVTNFILGGVILFLFYESVPFLSARIIGALWLISMPLWLYFSLRGIKDVSLQREKRLREQEFKKYIP